MDLSPVRDALAAAVIEKTKLAQEGPPLDPKMAALQKVIVDGRGSFGCAQKFVARIVELLSNVPEGTIKLHKTSFFQPGVAYVPVGNPNSHSYFDDEAVIIQEGDVGYRSDGEIGNHMPTNEEFPGSVRYATEEEIRAFFAVLPPADYPKLLAHIA